MFPCSVILFSTSLSSLSFPFACQFSPSLFPFMRFALLLCLSVSLHDYTSIHNTHGYRINLRRDKQQNAFYLKKKNLNRKRKAVLVHSQSSCKNTNRCSKANGLPVSVYESGLVSGRAAAKHSRSSAGLHQWSKALREKKAKRLQIQTWHWILYSGQLKLYKTYSNTHKKVFCNSKKFFTAEKFFCLERKKYLFVPELLFTCA